MLQVAVAMKNLDEAAKKYTDEYSIEPWITYEFNPKTAKDKIIWDKREDYTMHLALCNIGNVQWELIEPKGDKSIHVEFPCTHGEGLHHVAFEVENYEEVVKVFPSKGYKIL